MAEVHGFFESIKSKVERGMKGQELVNEAELSERRLLTEWLSVSLGGNDSVW